VQEREQPQRRPEGQCRVRLVEDPQPALQRPRLEEGEEAFAVGPGVQRHPTEGPRGVMSLVELTQVTVHGLRPEERAALRPGVFTVRHQLVAQGGLVG
jgi:hypothetical protein